VDKRQVQLVRRHACCSEGRGGGGGGEGGVCIKIICFLCTQQVCRVRDGGRGYRVIGHYPLLF
jgi:hypothetical protein